MAPKTLAAVAASALLTASLSLFPAPASATTFVDVELQLLLDTSGSVSPQDFNAQRNAYIGAFRRIMTAADARTITLPRFALQITAFSGPGQQVALVPWTLVDAPGKLNQVATQLANFTFQPFVGLTNVAPAVEYAVDQFRHNDFDGTRRIIDLSTDRVPNQTRDASESSGTPPAEEIASDLRGASQNALASDGIICIGNSSFCFPAAGGGVKQMNVILFNADTATETFYADNPVGCDGSLLSTGKLTSAMFGSEFEDKLTRNIVAEITTSAIDDVGALPPLGTTTAIPLPAAGWFLLTGLGGLFALGRRRIAT